MKIKTFNAKLLDLKPTSDNPRQIKKKDFEILKKSLREFPEMRELREVVIDENFTILGGHQRVKALEAIGEETVPVKQVFGLSEKQKREFIIKDNIANGDWDMDILANEWDEEPLEDWGLTVKGKYSDEDIEDLLNIEIPFYEPAEKPDETRLADTRNTDELIEKINKLKISEELKKIFTYRASFFTDFDFQKLADYYAHSDNDIKEIMEDLGLVIITPKKALEKGIVKLYKDIGILDED